jgi:hypothetical protein
VRRFSNSARLAAESFSRRVVKSVADMLYTI